MKKFNVFKKVNNSNTHNRQKENDYPIPMKNNTEIEQKEAILFEPNNMYILNDEEEDYEKFQIPTNVYDTFNKINYYMLASIDDMDGCKNLTYSFLSSVFSMYTNSIINLGILLLYDTHNIAGIIGPYNEYLNRFNSLINRSLTDFRYTILTIINAAARGNKKCFDDYVMNKLVIDVNVLSNEIGLTIYNFITEEAATYITTHYSNKELACHNYESFNKIFSDFMVNLTNESSIFAYNLLNVVHFVDYFPDIVSPNMDL